jgi:TPR repeat protein
MVLAASVAGAAGMASAQDKSDPWKVFKFGFDAYKSGHKEQALQAYRDASEQGQVGATWKLGRMYAEGDGVTQDDYEAYKYFREVVQQRVEPGSDEEAYVGDAYAELGRYSAEGIAGTEVQADLALAQEFYQRAAAYGSPTGQFEIGKMYLKERSNSNARQAGRWLKLAAKKGHQGARAMLGNLMFQSGRIVDGLAMMTAALERATPTDRVWIRSMQEEAFALTDEEQRRMAIERSQDFMQE